ncbi:hypothetical protein FHX82_007377 [Amycolatopsis bartoniae]|uniref:Uncharacterized protein n=1 Tax=Amycolatopsis bartoniae TaxID=941986 RepID=A0A8H9IWQ8_9PSEU|nr:cytochrome d ubiquinol oxidase subunit II [Amycolatopsis bartoniae]MBB2940290.1 hypothetical protein [Amycolatopsis bartoniae]TVT09482.1 cytochrome d ubiquinol oxidase subunit II [Amycolatopsis bartoniae]GHF53464.1 hypothetical protein GCM10017566_28600 [Amycolatopsis bartoniae]
MRRIGLATAAALVAALGLALTLGLLGGTPRGAGDNGDGYRLYCGAGLVPETPSHQANWQGGVVLDFVRGAPCPDPQPSSAAVFVRAVAGGQGPFSLVELGWLYVLLVLLATLLAAWAVQEHGPRRLLFLVPPLVPLLEPDFARLFLSTFGEPAGLFGAYTLLCGVAVIAATRVEDGFARLSALVLVAAGGVVAGLAKVGFLPLFALAVLVCLLTGVRLGAGRWWSARIAGPALAALLVLEMLAPVRAALDWQERTYADVNAVNLVYSLGLAEFPGSAPSLRLPEAAQDGAGHAFYPDGPDELPGGDIVVSAPGWFQGQVRDMLLAHPAALARVVGIGLQATEGRGLSYLPDRPWTPESRPPVNSGAVSGDMGGDPVTFRAWLDDMVVPWWPSLLVLLGLAAGVAALVWRRVSALRYGAVAAVAALGALSIAAVAVAGDGYFEIAKHVWLAAYLLDVVALSLVLAVVPVVVRRFRTRPAPSRPALETVG